MDTLFLAHCSFSISYEFGTVVVVIIVENYKKE